MKKIKPFFLAAKSKKAQHTLKVLSQKYNNYEKNCLAYHFSYALCTGTKN